MILRSNQPGGYIKDTGVEFLEHIKKIHHLMKWRRRVYLSDLFQTARRNPAVDSVGSVIYVGYRQE